MPTGPWSAGPGRALWRAVLLRSAHRWWQGTVSHGGFVDWHSDPAKEKSDLLPRSAAGFADPVPDGTGGPPCAQIIKDFKMTAAEHGTEH